MCRAMKSAPCKSSLNLMGRRARVGHYLDLTSAVLGVTSFPLGYLFEVLRLPVYGILPYTGLLEFLYAHDDQRH